MRKRSILIFAIPLALAVSLLAHAATRKRDVGWDVPLRRYIWANSSKETRVKLFTHLPGFFPVPFLCSLTQSSGQRATLLPGDLAEAAGGDAVLWCPGQLSATVNPGSSLRLEQEGSNASLYLLKGSAQANLGKQMVLFQADDVVARAKSESERSRLALGLSAEGTGIGCLEGLADVELSGARAKTSRSFLFASNCRLAVGEPGTPARIYLFNRDVTFRADLAIPRRLRPVQDFWKALGSFGLQPTGIQPSVLASAARSTGPDGHIILKWEVPKGGTLDCVLYSQAAETDAPKEFHRFKADKPAGEVVLQRDFRNFWISAACGNESGTLVSELVRPTK